MAKLSAHGYEVARLVYEFDSGERYGDRIQRYRAHLSFRSDGYVLRRLVALDLHGPGDHADFGWKLHRKLTDPKRDTVSRMAKLANGASLGAQANENQTWVSYTGPNR